jgi:hypothetical protein
MFNPTEVVIDAFEAHLRHAYTSTYTTLEPSYPGIISYVSRMALEIIANSDAPYHDFNHTMSVTLVGQEMLKGKHLREGGVSPLDWLHFTISLLCHDIGYVRGICKNDRGGRYVINTARETVAVPPGATDAALTPYHVERGKIFVRERFANNPVIDADIICANIEFTQFPVPAENAKGAGPSYPDLLRAADLIGQMADPQYMRRISALYREFQETGAAEKLGYQNAASLREAYPSFFWTMVRPYIDDGLRYLNMTQNGKQWIANLYAHVFAEEHDLPSLGPERVIAAV